MLLYFDSFQHNLGNLGTISILSLLRFPFREMLYSSKFSDQVTTSWICQVQILSKFHESLSVSATLELVTGQ